MTSRMRLLGIAAALVVTGTVGYTAPAGATPPPPVDGSGTVSCAVKAMLKFSPGLVATTTPVSTSVTFISKVYNCTGTGDGARVVSGTSKVTGTSPTNDCATVLLGAGGSSQGGPLKWKVTPMTQKLNDSTITFTTGSHSDGPPITADTSGTSTAGSFAGDDAVAHVVLKETYEQIVKKCTSANGLKAIHFTTGSTFDLSQPVGG